MAVLGKKLLPLSRNYQISTPNCLLHLSTKHFPRWSQCCSPERQRLGSIGSKSGSPYPCWARGWVDYYPDHEAFCLWDVCSIFLFVLFCLFCLFVLFVLFVLLIFCFACLVFCLCFVCLVYLSCLLSLSTTTSFS